MPVTPTYPGVYIQEEPSGVRTIVGVSTSVAAFVGQAPTGPVNEAVRVYNFSEYQRAFGGLHQKSEMSYAVRQFFRNGGGEAWIVRVAKNARASSTKLKNTGGQDVLEIKALNPGPEGDKIEVRVDYDGTGTGNEFNLRIKYVDEINPKNNKEELFTELSMNSEDAHYIEDEVNSASKLIRVNRIFDITTLTENGTACSGQLIENGALIKVKDVLNDICRELDILVVTDSGAEAVHITLDLDSLPADAATQLSDLCTQIKTQVEGVIGNTTDFDCKKGKIGDEVVDARILITSPTTGEKAKVRILPSAVNDATGALKFSLEAGMIYTDGVVGIRPAEQPQNGTLTGGEISTCPADSIKDTNRAFLISIDGGHPTEIDLVPERETSLELPNDSLEHRLNVLAERIQKVVRETNQISPSFKKFTCTVTGDKELILKSGTQGKGSSITILPKKNRNDADTLADNLKLLTDASRNSPQDTYLTGGHADFFSNEEAHEFYLSGAGKKTGINALEDVDLFNILCLPGITKSSIISDAVSYCEKRRAFLLIDPPVTIKTPGEMLQHAQGTALPKNDSAAVYYPWIMIDDPLTGRRRLCAPCGTVAGLYARTDVDRGVWKAPAGIDTNLNGVIQLDYILTDEEQGALNQIGVNCLRIFPVISSVSWGARTLRGADQLVSEYKYVPVRRLALFLEESLYRGLKWVVFEPNDEPLWASIRMNVKEFMHDLFRKGAFAGTTPDKAYFVKCDSETTTPNDQNLGIVNIWVGFAPLKPAEFVILHIQQIQHIKAEE